MKYLGGKAASAGDISGIINSLMMEHGIYNFVSLFCGSCAVESKVFGKKLLNDAHPYLISMWKALQEGWLPPVDVSESEYRSIRMHLGDHPALSGFVGFACSFGGKWFGGYAEALSRNYALEGYRSVTRRIEALQQETFTCQDYREVVIPDSALIYCDPPYAGTTGYSTGIFESDTFWAYADFLSRRHIVLVSEEMAPDHWVCLWEKPVTRTVNINKKDAQRRIEKLFIHEKWVTQ